jgi:hypothetical protein
MEVIMRRILVFMATLFLAVIFCYGLGLAADQARDQDRMMDQDQIMDQDRLLDKDIYGWELMTREEREEHRNRMRSFKTEKEREQYRLEHHERMQERARAQGRVLPDMPPEGGRGMGPGGGGMGPGGGYGSGGGR